MHENAQPIADVLCFFSNACLLHPSPLQVAALMREHAQPIADVLVKEVAKPAVDAYTGG